MNAHQRISGSGEPKKGQSRKVWLFWMTLISWFLGPSILGGIAASSGKHLHLTKIRSSHAPPTTQTEGTLGKPVVNPCQGTISQRLTQDADEGVGQQVTVLVGSVALVDGTAAHLHGVEHDSVAENLSARVVRRIWG